MVYYLESYKVIPNPFWDLPYTNMNHKKELLRGLWEDLKARDPAGGKWPESLGRKMDGTREPRAYTSLIKEDMPYKS